MANLRGASRGRPPRDDLPMAALQRAERAQGASPLPRAAPRNPMRARALALGYALRGAGSRPSSTVFICCPQQISEWAISAGQGHAFVYTSSAPQRSHTRR